MLLFAIKWGKHVRILHSKLTSCVWTIHRFHLKTSKNIPQTKFNTTTLLSKSVICREHKSAYDCLEIICYFSSCSFNAYESSLELAECWCISNSTGAWNKWEPSWLAIFLYKQTSRYYSRSFYWSQACSLIDRTSTKSCIKIYSAHS